MAKAWSVGHEGTIGISLFLDSPNRDYRADVELGGLAYRLSAAALRTEFRRAGALQHLLLRYVSALVTQSSQLCVCRQHHTVEQRFCSFLLRTFDQANGENAFITQMRIGMLLGVRRESITEIALRFQGAGIIKYRKLVKDLHLCVGNRGATARGGKPMCNAGAGILSRSANPPCQGYRQDVAGAKS